ncbi:MAG: hypothetical protein P4L87_01620 [Formivibrio sp.]|nr:hypothetical protein [Formivibrio sp.]
MQRMPRTAGEIRAYIHRRVNDINAVNVVVYLPHEHTLDERGCNWDMREARNCGPYIDSVRQVIEEAKAKFTLCE